MKKEELVEKTNKAISELVCEKVEMQKAYNYYNCERDKELFKYLEENFGIGLPTEVKFIPLIKKHVDALIGEYLDIPIQPKVSCKDKETINNIFREKQLKIATEHKNLLIRNLKNNLLRSLGSLDFVDLNIKEQLDKITEDINENFISEYEIAGLNIVEYIIQSRNIDLYTKLRLIFLDILVGGFGFYRVKPSESKENIKLECLDPRNTFPDLNYDSPYIKDSYRVVVRTYMSRNEVLNKYGKLLSREDIEKIKDIWSEYLDLSGSVFVRSHTNSRGLPTTDGILAGQEVTPEFQGLTYFNFDNSIIPVYEVEWKETDKDFIEQRYSTVRIGEEIYILNGKDENVVRTKDDPTKCSLSVNGIWLCNRNYKPYSLVKASMDLQD